MIASSGDSVVPDYESENETSSDGNGQVLQNRKRTRGANKIYKKIIDSEIHQCK